MTARVADEHEFRRVARLFMPAVVRCLHKFGFRALPEEIEDAMQTVLLRLWKNWESLDRTDDERLVSYACVTAVTVARDWAAYRQSTTCMHAIGDAVALEEFARNPVPGWDDHTSESLEIVDAILATMPCEPREVFILYEINGYSAKEIADALAIPTGTVASRLRIARAQFEARVKARALMTEETTT